MTTMLTILEPSKESTLVKYILEKNDIQIITSKPIYTSFIKALQYSPDVILMELPKKSMHHLMFLNILQKDPSLRKIPLILFGNSLDPSLQNILNRLNVKKYLKKPLKTKILLDEIEQCTGVLVHRDDEKTYNTNRQVLPEELSVILCNSFISKKQKIACMIEYVNSLFLFPMTVVNLLSVIDDKKSGALELAKIISSDPSVATEVLRVANNLQHIGRGKRVSTVKDAVIRIGLEEVKKIVFSLSVIENFSFKSKTLGFNHNEFWTHSLSVAVIAEEIAKRKKNVDPCFAFLGGLIHDIGILLYNEFFNELFVKCLERSVDLGMSLCEAEREIIGVTDGELTCALFEKWNFPGTLVKELSRFKNIDYTNQHYDDNSGLATILMVSNMISRSLSLGNDCDHTVFPIENTIMESLGLSAGVPRPFIDDIYEGLNKCNSVVKVNSKKFTYGRKKKNIILQTHSYKKRLFDPIRLFLLEQGYMIKDSDGDFELFLHCEHSHGTIILDFIKEKLPDIEYLQNRSSLQYHDSPLFFSKSRIVEKAPMKLLVLDDKHDMTETYDCNTLCTSYPVDLRRISLQISGLFHGIPIPSVENTFGSLTWKNERRNALLIHRDHGFREKIKKLLCDTISLYEVGDESEGVALAKNGTQNYHYILLDFHISNFKCQEIVEALQGIPSRKNCKIVLCVQSTTKEEIIPMIQMGVRDFIMVDAPEGATIKTLITSGLLA